MSLALLLWVILVAKPQVLPPSGDTSSAPSSLHVEASVPSPPLPGFLFSPSSFCSIHVSRRLELGEVGATL